MGQNWVGKAALIIWATWTSFAASGCGETNVNVSQPPSPGQQPGQVPPESPSPAPAPTNITIQITEIFTPTPIIVTQNVVNVATIVIVNNVTEEHWIIADDGSFNSGLIQAGESITFDVDKPGDHPFHCGIHQGERGILRVNPPVAAPSPTPTSSPGTTPTVLPTSSPTTIPTATPTGVPTFRPTSTPTESPTSTPTASPTPIESPAGTIIITTGASNRSNNAFASGPIRVPEDSTVTIINSDVVDHTATADNGSFNTGIISKGENATISVSEAGNFPFHCEIHPNMRGVLIIEAVAQPSPTPTLDEPGETPMPTSTPDEPGHAPEAFPTPGESELAS